MSGDEASRLRDLSAEECRELLAGHSYGRVAWDDGGGPLIMPVTYGMHAGDVVFRTSPYGSLAALTRPTVVAFEIDGVDEEAGVGWSVLVRGRASAVALPQELVQLWTRDDITPWAPGVRNLFIAITPTSTTGRRVSAPYARG